MQNQNNGGFSDDPNVSEEQLGGVDLFKDIDPANATPEQVAAIVKTGKTLLVQKKVWREKAIDPTTGKPFKDLFETAKSQIPPKPDAPAAPNELQKDVALLKEEREKRLFAHANGLDPEETDHLFAFAKGSGVKPADALNHPFFKTALEGVRQAKSNDGATPGSSRRAPVVEGKTFAEMKPEERAKNFGAVVSSLTKKK